ncbi:acyltransferase domain-containing protein [Mycolicibacterium sp. P9-64]|uniref:ACP S-malonyltransferase n=1 Tax=Mycolicibacterium sp. P9-64 TaxID=2024612 RepID=UPI0011EC8DE6|nr:acyltransferase domain-containing protein [Mycolicibacterium sp. P9-64]KAA0074928.1 acyltransferase domain-containing protein [Mycolicibacterium sp. P9-64]
MSFALLFPGQGTQQPNMLSKLPNGPAATAVVDESRSSLEHLGIPGPIDDATALHDTTNAQLALLIAGVACARALTEDHGLTPQFVAGHSVGAFAAAVTANVLTLHEAITAVRLRGDLMKEACAEGDWGMAAVAGLPTRTVVQLVERLHTHDEPLWIANVNSATQTVVSGSVSALRDAAVAAEAAGARDYTLLDVAVASHCPLQAGTAERMRAHLSGLPRRPATAQYLTNTRGRSVRSADTILADLAAAVVQPVQWYDATRLLPELGGTVAVETQPGHVLTRLNAANAPTVLTLSMQDNGIDAIVTRALRSR